MPFPVVASFAHHQLVPVHGPAFQSDISSGSFQAHSQNVVNHWTALQRNSFWCVPSTPSEQCRQWCRSNHKLHILLSAGAPEKSLVKLLDPLCRDPLDNQT